MAIGALIVHMAVKLPIIRDALRGDVDDDTHDRPTAVDEGALSRRGLLRTTWVATGVAVLATAGATVPLLRRVSVLGVRSGEGPGGVRVNKSAQAARITDDMVGSDWRLTVVVDGVETAFSRADLVGLAQRIEILPIACVWGGVPAASGPVSGCVTCSTLSGHPEVRICSCGRCRPRGRFVRPLCRGTSPPTTLVPSDERLRRELLARLVHVRVEERLDRLENELAIRALAHEYCHGADKQDRARFASVWAPDGVWAVSDEQEFSGVAAICDAVTQQWDAFREMHHWTANHVVTFDGDDPDCAAGEADVRVLIVFRDGTRFRGGGTYLDRYTRSGGVWRISRREVGGVFADGHSPASTPTEESD